VKPFQGKFKRLSSVTNFSAKGKGVAETISSPIEAWSLLFSDNLLNIILKCTNQEMDQKRNNFCLKRKINSQYNELGMLELKAFIGLLYYAGWAKRYNVSVRKKFSTHSLRLFQDTIPMTRFIFLSQCLSFDDKTTHNERFKINCFAKISEIWNLFRNLFITNCIQYYEPGYNVTIDEQILSFNGRGIYYTSLSHKHGTRGIKFVTMNDSETFYMINAIPYINNC